MNKKERIIDGDLVIDFQSGKNEAFVVLVKRWHKTFCDKAFWIVKDADIAKDIAQDCWQVIMSKLYNLKDPYSFGGWALRIVYTKSIDVINTNNRKLKVYNELKKEESSSAIELQSEDITIKETLLKAIESLPENQQMVIKLFYIQEHSLKEISVLLDISIGTAKSRLFHAREKLKQSLKYRNYEK